MGDRTTRWQRFCRITEKNGSDLTAPKHKPIEASIHWAAENGFRYIDFQADVPPNNIAAFDAARVRTVRSLCETHDIAIGIHPSSAINNAEYVPIMAEAVDNYLYANLELAQQTRMWLAHRTRRLPLR